MTELRFTNLWNEFDFLFKEMNGHLTNGFDYKYQFPVDIYATKKGNILNIDIPVTGCEKKDVKIKYEKDILMVTKEVAKEPEVREYEVQGIAKRKADFSWRISNRFDLSQIKGKMENGLLHIEIPIKEEEKITTNFVKIE